MNNINSIPKPVQTTESTNQGESFDANQVIQNRLIEGLSNTQIRGSVHDDFVDTFTSIGMEEADAMEFADRVIELIQAGATLEETEAKMQELFTATAVEEVPFRQKLEAAMRNRENIIVGQVSPLLEGVAGKVVDYGAGSGKVAQGVHDKLGLDVEGYEVSDFKSPDVTIPVIKFDGRHLPVEEGHYEAGIVTNVLHHEANNEDILNELTRAVRSRLVVIETVPAEDTPESREQCFATDAFWNRFFFNANVPVPGTYETPERWIERFESKGWKCTHSESLGYDQPAVRDIHHLFVFERE